MSGGKVLARSSRARRAHFRVVSVSRRCATRCQVTRTRAIHAAIAVIYAALLLAAPAGGQLSEDMKRILRLDPTLRAMERQLCAEHRDGLVWVAGAAVNSATGEFPLDHDRWSATYDADEQRVVADLLGICIFNRKPFVLRDAETGELVGKWTPTSAKGGRLDLEGASPGRLATIAMGALAIVAYCLPWIVARKRRHPNLDGIVVVNLFLGWTVLGWIAALTWAASYKPPPPPERERGV